MSKDLDKYFAGLKDSLNKRSEIVRNPNIFDFNYVPETVFIREELKTIMDNIVQFDHLHAPFNLFIYGAKGSGKTLMIKYLSDYLKNKIEMPITYVNCRVNNTSFRILSELTGNELNCGLGSTEIYKELMQKHKRLVVILDEIDLLSIREKGTDILYFLSRSECSYMVILLSNNPHFYNRIDLSAKSSLQLEKMHFRNYNAEEVYEILKIRCKEGLNKYNDEDLKKIAALTAKDSHGDVRIAIKTLQYSIANKYEKIEKNFEKAKEDMFIDLIFHQNDQMLLVLKAINSSKQSIVKPVYETYKNLCNAHKESAYSYMHFYNSLSYLQSIGLILLITTKVYRGKTYSIELLFDADALTQIFSHRFLNCPPPPPLFYKSFLLFCLYSSLFIIFIYFQYCNK